MVNFTKLKQSASKKLVGVANRHRKAAIAANNAAVAHNNAAKTAMRLAKKIRKMKKSA